MVVDEMKTIPGLFTVKGNESNLMFDTVAKRWHDKLVKLMFNQRLQWQTTKLVCQKCDRDVCDHRKTQKLVKKEVPVSQGMYSGLRLTNVFNTMFNLVYSRMAHNISNNLFDSNGLNDFDKHRGDDVAGFTATI